MNYIFNILNIQIFLISNISGLMLLWFSLLPFSKYSKNANINLVFKLLEFRIKNGRTASYS